MMSNRNIIVCCLMILLNLIFANTGFSGCISSDGMWGMANALTFRLYSDGHNADVHGVYEIEASRHLSLGVSRHGRLEKGRGVQVLIYAKSKGEDYKLVCEHDLRLDGSHEGVDVEVEEEGDIQWKVKVYDKDEGKPNLLALHFWSKSNASKQLKTVSSSVMSPTYLQFLKAYKADDRLVAECRHSVVDKHLVRDVSALSLPPMSKRVPFIATVQAGRNLYLEMRGSELAYASAEIRLVAKNSEVHAFIPICKVVLSSGEATFVHATLPWDNWDMETTWRVEVVGESDGPAEAEHSATLVVMTDTGVVLTEEKHGVERQFTCLNEFLPRSLRNPTSESAAFWYARAILLNVEFDDPSNYLTDAGREVFKDLLLHVVNTWRGACFECTAFHFSLIRVGEDWYAADHLVEYLDWEKKPVEGMTRPAPLQLMRPNPKRNILGRGNTNIPVFVRKSREELMQMACGVNDQLREVPISHLKGVLGCPSEAHISAAVTVLISLLDNGTSCSNSENVVACEQANYSIELNVRDFAFDDPEGRIIWGNARKHVPLAHVLGHEFGHWIGLDHINSTNGIMAESLETSRCLDDATASALNALMTGARSPVSRPGALLYESN